MTTMKKLLIILFGATQITNCGNTNKNIISNQNVMTVSQIDTTKHTEDLLVNLKVLNETQINISVNNASKNLIRVYSHVETEEKHYDYFEIEAITPDHDKMFFSFYDKRDKSAPVIVELKSGESFSHTIDFLKWTERNINKETIKSAGFNHLPHGIKIRAKYRNSPCENCNEYYKSIWTGYIYSDWVDF